MKLFCFFLFLFLFLFFFCFFFVKFIYWSKFHVNIITNSRVLTIYFYKWLNRNLDIGTIPVWVFPIIWKLGQVTETTFGANVAKCYQMPQSQLLHFLSYNRGRGERRKIPPSRLKLNIEATIFLKTFRIKRFWASPQLLLLNILIKTGKAFTSTLILPTYCQSFVAK